MHITILSTYPGGDPRHGGQHRLANIVASLEADGHRVSSVGVLGSDSYDPTPGFLPFPGYAELQRYIDNAFLMEDWAIGQLAVSNQTTYRSLARLMPRNIDLIICEQPWLWGFAAKYSAAGLTRKVQLVYGSQNVESELKYEIVKSYFGLAQAQKCRELVLKSEVEAARGADLVLAVSETDATWVTSHSRARVVLAPNGVTQNRAAISDVVAANEITGGAKFALYAASAHPPNIFGFYEIFGNGVGCFAPDQKMVVAGSAGTAIRNDKRFDSVAGLSKCFINAGSVTDGQLQGLLQSAHCIFLPLTSGGGTNLKSAEALWTGRGVVATKLAMRGFERFSDSPGVRVASSPSEFLKGLQRTLAEPRFEIDMNERAARTSLLWSHSLKPMVAAVKGLAR